jgi:hypothetical protein
MKKLVLAVALVMAEVGLGGCLLGKGPAPVITKG